MDTQDVCFVLTMVGLFIYFMATLYDFETSRKPPPTIGKQVGVLNETHYHGCEKPK